MKTTAQRLSEVYCRPTNEAEWVKSIPWLNGDYMLSDIAKTSFLAFGDGTISKDPQEGMVEIPVQHFIDLMEDNIVAWRLVEDGFIKTVINKHCDLYTLKNNNCDVCIYIYYDGTFEVWLQDEFTEIRMNIKTYSDLLTLIRFMK